MSLEKKLLAWAVANEHTKLLSVLVPVMQAWFPVRVAAAKVWRKYIAGVAAANTMLWHQ